jgi:hypothetical protein
LKINTTIRGLESKTPAAPAEESPNRVRLAKERRADDPEPWTEVHVIKDVPRVDAEGEVKAPVAVGSSTEEAAQPTATSTQSARAQTTTYAPATTAPTSTTAAISPAPG